MPIIISFMCVLVCAICLAVIALGVLIITDTSPSSFIWLLALFVFTLLFYII